jgi:hypothetical protein
MTKRWHVHTTHAREFVVQADSEAAALAAFIAAHGHELKHGERVNVVWVDPADLSDC